MFAQAWVGNGDNTVLSALVEWLLQFSTAPLIFELVLRVETRVACGVYAIAPDGRGLIEDLVTVQTACRRGMATAMIAAFSERLRASGCHAVFIGALASERFRRL